MRIAHFSDLHVLAIEGVAARRFLNKRLTGWVNLRLKRGSIHRTAYVRAIAQEIRRLEVDHVVVTGDLTNLALEPEFALARTIIEDDLGLDPSRVTIVPGNHDTYTRGAFASGRFEQAFDAWLRTDLPDTLRDPTLDRFPVVKLRGPLAIVALSSAVPRLPMVAAGELGATQMEALRRVLAHPEVARRTVALAMHHPAVHDASRAKTYLEGLRDARELVATLGVLRRAVLLHGHLHRRVQRHIVTAGGKLHQIGAGSASLHDAKADKMAGFNLYEIGDEGSARVLAHVYVPETRTFRIESVPKYV